MRLLILLALIANTPLAAAAGPAAGAARPNILWLVSEDHSPRLGCYGDNYARTPNIDALAARSLRFTRAISNAPVCAAARTTLISGMYASSTGGEHMRSRVTPPGFLKFYPQLMRAAGYYCSNNAKEDYNFATAGSLWDASSGKAGYAGRPAGQPFLAVFNSGESHESVLHRERGKLVSDPAKARVPGYLPDTAEVRADLAANNDSIARVDGWVGKQLAALEQAGVAEETIVFFFSDHGGALARGKRYPGWSGLHVPLIVYFPEKWRHLAPAGYQPGQTSDRLVSFVDFAPTLLSLAGAEIPAWHEGKAFLGPAAVPAAGFSFGLRGRMDERPDVCRSVTDGRFMYIRNFMPQLAHGEHYAFQQKAASARQWREMFLAGKLTTVQAAYWLPHPPEELFDLHADPDETRNLAADPAQAATVARFRAALRAHMLATRDLALLPEPIMQRLAIPPTTPWDLGHNPAVYPLERLLDLTDMQLQPAPDPVALAAALADHAPLVRYWAVISLVRPGAELPAALAGELLRLLGDPEPLVRVAAGNALTRSANATADARQRALDCLLAAADPRAGDFFTALHALHALDHARPLPEPTVARLRALAAAPPRAPSFASEYLPRLFDHLLGPAER